MTDRRSFLLQAIALVLGGMSLDLTDDSFLLEVGCLCCGGRREGRLWELAITVYVERCRCDGAVMIRRMVPTDLLRVKLRHVGVPVVFDGDQIYPSLVGTTLLGPAHLRERMAMVVSGCDWTALYFDSEPWAWEARL